MELKHVFGKPREGFHALRTPVLDLALNDILGTIIIAYLITFLYTGHKDNFYTVFVIILISLFILGHILHKAVGLK